MAIFKPMRYINKFAEAVIALLFTAIVVVGTLQVFNRYVLNVSLSWSEEFQKFAFIWLVFIAIPVAYNRSAHLRVETFFDLMPQRLRFVLRWVFDLLWAGFGVSLVIFTWRLMQVTKYQSSPGLGISMSIVYAGMVVGGVYLVLCVAASMVGRLQSMRVNS